jgi:Uma2 family endonuclease
MGQRASTPTPEPRPRYLEDLAPLHFPEEAEVPETQLHLELRLLLYQLLSDTLGLDASVGSDQFVYFDAADPGQVLAPDVFVRLEPRGELIRSWKVWERGAPDVAVEIVSDWDAPATSWRQKLHRYQQLGVKELLRFNPQAAPGQQLRIWDRVGDVLCERLLENAKEPLEPSLVLGLHWVLAPADGLPLALRVAFSGEGHPLLPTRIEARKAETKAREAETKAREAETKAREAETKAREAAEAGRDQELEARTLAEARVRELEAALAALDARK